MEPLWNVFYRYICGRKLVIEMSSGTLGSTKGSSIDLVFANHLARIYVYACDNQPIECDNRALTSFLDSPTARQ